MENLIMNSQWAPGPSGGPQYFSGFGPITYDDLSINGYRTCSITMVSPMVAQDFYEPMIDVRGRASINWGWTTRTVDADGIALVAEFHDLDINPITTYENPITGEVTFEFKQIISKFAVPIGTENVRLAIKFTGRITACTLYTPFAFYA